MSENEVRKILIRNATLIDGTGSEPLENAAVLIDGDKIETVLPAGEIGKIKNTEIIEGKGKYLLPGLVDSHVHIYHPGFVPMQPKGDQTAYAGVIAANNLRSALQAGITTLRGVCDKDHLDIAMREAVERRVIIGPRLFVAGIGICMTGGHGSQMEGFMHEVDTPDEVRKAVRQEIKAGTDLIKLLSSHRTDYPEFSQAEITAGTEEAHRFGKKVAIHAANFISTRMAAVAGVDTIEHGSFIDEETADMMAEKDIIWVPTFWVKNYIPQIIEHMRDKITPGSEFNLDMEDMQETYAWFSGCVERLPKTAEILRERGVRTATGTDNVFANEPFAVLGREIECFTKYGYSNMEAIISATRGGAEAIGKEDEFGTVEAGKYADLIMVDRNPLDDITVLGEVSWVMKEGEVIGLYPEWQSRPIQEPLHTK